MPAPSLCRSPTSGCVSLRRTFVQEERPACDRLSGSTAASGSVRRDVRLDLIRGYALLAVAINHLSGLIGELGLAGPKIPTLTSLGFSSAAEIFFLLSGYMVGLVYMRSPGTSRRLIERAWSIYKVNAVVFVIVVLIAEFGSASFARITFVEYTQRHPFWAIPEYLAFLQHPMFLDVLLTYVALMIVAPLAIRLMRTHPRLFATIAVALYLAVQFDSRLNLPVHYGGTEGKWDLNPFAWQLLFFGGAFAGWRGRYDRLAAWVSLPAVAVCLGAAFIISMAVTVLEHHGHPTGLAPGLTDKQNLGVLRLLHTAVVIGLLTYLLGVARKHLSLGPFKLMALVGRHTLHCFAVSIVGAYALALLWTDLWPTYLGYLLSAGVMLGAVCLTAWHQERRKRLLVARSVEPPPAFTRS